MDNKKKCNDDFTGALHDFEEMYELYGGFYTAPDNPLCTTTTKRPVDNSTASLKVYGNVAYALGEYKVLSPVMFAVMLLLIVLCFFIFFVQYKRLSPISTSVYAMLISITIFNFLSITGAFVEHTFLYTKKSDMDLLPLESCDTLYKIEKWSQITHAVSIWLTASMTIQKCICVCKPFAASRIVSINATVLLISGSIFLGFAPFTVKFFDSTFRPYLVSDVGHAGQTFTTCRRKLATFITEPLKYMVTMSWVIVIMSRVLPCIIILITSVIMIVQLRKHNTTLRKMSQVKRTEDKPEVSQKTRVVKLVFFVATVVFVVEITTSIVYILFIIQVYEGIDIIDTEATRNAAIGIDIALYISYVVILMSYCLTPSTIRRFKTRLSEIRSSRSSGQNKTKQGYIGEPSSKSKF